MIFQKRANKLLHVSSLLVWVNVNEFLFEEGLNFLAFYIGTEEQQLVGCEQPSGLRNEQFAIWITEMHLFTSVFDGNEIIHSFFVSTKMEQRRCRFIVKVDFTTHWFTGFTGPIHLVVFNLLNYFEQL